MSGFQASVEMGLRAAALSVLARYREFAVADAFRQQLGEQRDLFLTMDADQFVEGGIKRGAGETAALDARENGFSERLGKIAERLAALFGSVEFRDKGGGFCRHHAEH
jgi:hypothetical protein